MTDDRFNALETEALGGSKACREGCECAKCLLLEHARALRGAIKGIRLTHSESCPVGRTKGHRICTCGLVTVLRLLGRGGQYEKVT